MKLDDFIASRAYHSLGWAAGAMILIMAIGTVGYRLMGGAQYTWMDCFYMTFITVATIGFSETVDISHIQGGRLFTIAIATLGIGTMTYMLSTFAAFILESDINEAWRRRKMQSKIDKLQDHYIVCGIGRVGSNVAQELTLTGRNCVIVDANREQIENYLERHPQQLYLHGDATDNDILLAAGVMRARGVFSVASDDSQNLVISLSTKQLNPNLRVVARCHDMKNVEKTRRAGADEIVSPDFTGGLRLVSAMLRPNAVLFLDEMIKSEDNLRLEEIVVTDDFSGQVLSSLSSVTRDCVVLAIRQGGEWIFNPPAHHVAQGGDILMVMTTPHGRARLEGLIQGAS